MSGRDEKEKFLGRWSRLKSGAATPDPDLPAAEQPPATEATRPAGEDGDPEIVAGLPDIETLDKDSDYTVFLQDGVPEHLKNLALRRLWRSDPVLANLDGLNDYDHDFGAILRDGAAYMKKLVDAGERMTRPGAGDEADEVAPDREAAPGEGTERAAAPGETEIDDAANGVSDGAKPVRPV